MQGIYEKFPEVLLVDATYKLLDLRLPVFLLMCVNGDGLSEIAGMFILSEETKDVISATVDVFKKHKPAHSRTEVIMSDKDFTERDAFSCCFPNASLIICLYHTVRSFRRKIVCDKLGISSAERLHALEILQAMATSRSASEYDKHLTSLKNTNMQSIIDYVLENWDPIKEQWVAYYKDKSFNRGETTNNRLESTFAKIKSVCSRYASLMQFFTELFAVLKCFREERHHHYLMAIFRRDTEFFNIDKENQLFYNHLTPYAFDFVAKQLDLSTSVHVVSKKSSTEFLLSASSKSSAEPHTATPTSCDCSFYTRTRLPRKHNFKVRSILRIPTFSLSLSPLTVERFPETPEYRDIENMNGSMMADQPQSLHITSMPDVGQMAQHKILTQAQKFCKGMQLSQTLVSLASEGGMPTFRQRYTVLQSIINS